jgi:hypothetical protein
VGGSAAHQMWCGAILRYRSAPQHPEFAYISCPISGTLLTTEKAIDEPERSNRDWLFKGEISRRELPLYVCITSSNPTPTNPR